MKTLLEQSPSSKSLSKLWTDVLEEERTLHRRFEVSKISVYQPEGGNYSRSSPSSVSLQQ